jgi:hypothetical protein
MGNKIIWSLLILLISFTAWGKSSKNNVARQPHVEDQTSQIQSLNAERLASLGNQPEAIISEPAPETEPAPAPPEEFEFKLEENQLYTTVMPRDGGNPYQVPVFSLLKPTAATKDQSTTVDRSRADLALYPSLMSQI